MACYVGMTQNPQQREEEHRREHPNLSGFRVLTPCLTYDQAIEAERRLAREYGCTQHAGGPRAPGCWYVYIFYY